MSHGAYPLRGRGASPPQQSKASLRARLREARQAHPPEARAQKSRLIVQTIAALEVYARAASVATYLPLPTEVDVSGLTARAHADGKAVFLPWFNRSGELLFIGVGPDSPVERGPMGVKRPVRGQLSRLATTLDLVILPGLAFDLRGGRLGFGGGFYDRGLSQLSDGHRLAVGFDFQVVDRVPMDSGDEPMDTLVTELRVARLPSRLPDR